MYLMCLSENARVMVLAATNRPWELDEAILRRLPRAFEVGMPDKKQRSSILKVILKDENYEDCLDIEQLAALTDGYSGSDLTELCKEAAYMPIRDLLDEERVQGDGGVAESKEPRPLKQSDFLSVLSTARTSKTAAYEYQHNRSTAMDGSQGRAPGSSSDDSEPVDTSVTDLLKLLAAFGAASSAANSAAANNR